MTSPVAERLTRRIIDEMHPSDGPADYGRVTVSLVQRSVRQPMLHVRARVGAFEKMGSSIVGVWQPWQAQRYSVETRSVTRREYVGSSTILERVHAERCLFGIKLGPGGPEMRLPLCPRNRTSSA